MVRICVRFRGPSCRLSVHRQYRGHRTACGLVTGRVWRRAGTDLGDGGYCCEQRMVAKPPWASSQRAMQCQCGTLISALWWVDWGKGLEVCGARAPRIRGIEQPSQMAFTYCHFSHQDVQLSLPPCEGLWPPIAQTKAVTASTPQRTAIKMITIAAHICTRAMRCSLQAHRLGTASHLRRSFSTRSSASSILSNKTLPTNEIGKVHDFVPFSNPGRGYDQASSVSTAAGTNCSRILEAEHKFAFDSRKADQEFIQAFIKRYHTKYAPFQRMPSQHIRDEYRFRSLLSPDCRFANATADGELRKISTSIRS